MSQFALTVFPKLQANTMTAMASPSFKEFCDSLAADAPEFDSKAEMPLFCPMLFDGSHSAKGALRHDKGVTLIYGACGDHDSGTMSMEEARQRLEKAGVEAFLYTTPSWTLELPRWRVVVPFSNPTSHAHDHLVAVEKLNHILDGTMKSESFTLSQSFYFGRIKGKQYQTAYVAGACIDTCYKERRPKVKLTLVGAASDTASDGPTDSAELVQIILRGAEGMHEAQRTLSARMAAQGFEEQAIIDYLTGLTASSDAANTERGQARLKEVTRLVRGAMEKFAPPPMARIRPTPKAKMPPKADKPAVEAPDAPADLLPKSFSLSQLLEMQIPATRWLVEGLIAPGLTLLTAPPKQGKSYFALQMGMCVAAGEYFLGRKTHQTRVTYFDLEEWHGLLLERVLPIMHGNGIAKAVPFHIELETGTGDAALEHIAREIEAGSELVIVDLLARVRDESGEDAKKNVYARDMSFMGRMATFALEHPGVAIVVVHHANKGNHDDWQNKISGSAGVAGAVHSNLYMARPDMRGKDEAEKREAAQYRVLHTNGKQVKEQEITLQMMPDGGGWATSDMKSYEIALTHKRKRILEVLKHAAPEYMTAQDVADAVNGKAANVRQMMTQMALDGIIKSDGRGGKGFAALS